jgi:hypothetical protein
MVNLEAQMMGHQNAQLETVVNLLPVTHTTMKLELLRFDGSDPLGWIFKINQFFNYHGTLEDQ